MQTQKVIVFGASDKPDRYSNQAVILLREKGHEVLPVNPNLKEISGIKVWASLEEIANAYPNQIQTLTMYVNPEISTAQQESIIRLKPIRVIFNPGSENPDLALKLSEEGIETLEACTLVLLKTGQF